MATVANSRASSPATQAWELYRQVFTAHQPRFMRICADFELSKQQVFALQLLDPERPVAMSELAAAMFCDNSNITGIVDRLEDRGLVERRAAPLDRRVKIVALTSEGRELRDAVLERISEPPPELDRLSAEDQRALRDILRRALGRA